MPGRFPLAGAGTVHCASAQQRSHLRGASVALRPPRKGLLPSFLRPGRGPGDGARAVAEEPPAARSSLGSPRRPPPPPAGTSPPLYPGLTPAGCSHVRLRWDLFAASLARAPILAGAGSFSGHSDASPVPQRERILAGSVCKPAEPRARAWIGARRKWRFSQKTFSCEELNAATISWTVGERRNQHGQNTEGLVTAGRSQAQE